MIREVDLVSYLPEYLTEFKENTVALEAENPEFVLVWQAADRVLLNEFIETADEYGISRFEKILGILPLNEDTIESRRARIKAQWFKSIPYTFNVLIERLTALCGENNFTVEKHYENYEIVITVYLPLIGQVDELDAILSYIAPANIVVKANNVLKYELQSSVTTGGVTVETKSFTVDSKTEKEEGLFTSVTYGATVVQTIQRVIDTKDAILNKEYNLTASLMGGSITAKTITKTIS